MPEAPLANAPEARTPTGEIVDRAAPTTTTPPASTTPPEPPTSTTAPATTETPKPEGDKSLLNKEEPKAEGVPEKYDFKVPEGFELDEAVSKEATELFKGLKLSQDGAQKLIDFYTAKTVEAAEAPFKAYSDLREKWQADVKADPDIGSKLPQVKETVSRALDTLGDPALAKSFREAMDLTGAGDNPAFIKTFFKLAQRVTEGRAVLPGGPAPVRNPNAAPPDAAHALYPNLP